MSSARLAGRLRLNRIRIDTGVVLRAIVVLVVLGATYYIGPRLGQYRVRLIIAALIAAGGAVVIIRHKQLMLLVLVPAATLIPLDVGTGTESSINAIMLAIMALTALWVFDMVVGERRVELISTGPIVPLYLLMATVLLAFLAGWLPWYPVSGASLASQVGGLSLFLLSGVAFMMMAHVADDPVWVRRVSWTFLAIGALYVVSSLGPQAGRMITSRFLPRSTGAVFWIWLLAIPLSQALFNTKLRSRWRYLLLLLAVGALVVNLRTFSWKSGWMPMLVVMVTLAWLRMPRWRLFMLIAGGIFFAPLAYRLFQAVIIDENYSWVTRLAAWEIVWDIAKVNPLLGVGPSNYYFYTPLYNILGWDDIQFNSHSQYLDLVAQTGVLGLVFFLWFFVSMFFLCWQIKDQMPSGFARAYVYGALAAIVAMLFSGLLGDWIIPFVYNVGTRGFRSSVLGWIFLGGVIALARYYGEDAPPDAEAKEQVEHDAGAVQ